MSILNDTVLESNKYLKLNFDGGELWLQFTGQCQLVKLQG